MSILPLSLHRLLRKANKGLKSSIGRNGLGVGAVTAAELVLGLAAALILARNLGPEGLGSYSLTFAIALIAGIPVEIGVPTLTMREIARLSGEGGSPIGVIVFAVMVITAMSCAVSPLVVLLGRHVAPEAATLNPTLLLFAALLIPVSGFLRTSGAALCGLDRVVLGQAQERFIRPLLFVFGLTAAVMAGPDGWLTPSTAMGVQLAATSATMLIAAGCLFWLWPRTQNIGVRRVRAEWALWITSTLRLGLAQGIRVAQSQLLLLVTGSLSTPENVGILRVAQRGAGLAAFCTTVLISTSSPRFARLGALADWAALQRLLTAVSRLAALATLSVLILYVFLGQWALIWFLGAGFGTAWIPLLILTLTEALRASFGLGGALLNMLRREQIATSGFALSLTVTLSLAVLLVPSAGATGAAWATLFGGVAMFVFFKHTIRKRLGLDPSAFPRRPPS